MEARPPVLLAAGIGTNFKTHRGYEFRISHDCPSTSSSPLRQDVDLDDAKKIQLLRGEILTSFNINFFQAVRENQKQLQR